MGGEWFTETGTTGELRVGRRGDDWFVHDRDGGREIKCIVVSDVALNESADRS
jgi:hypothetical protein